MTKRQSAEKYVIIIGIVAFLFFIGYSFFVPPNLSTVCKNKQVSGISDCSSLNVTKEHYIEDERQGVVYLCEGDIIGPTIMNFTMEWINDTAYKWQGIACLI